jgi:predicted cupin superfamily sugar epimerase
MSPEEVIELLRLEPLADEGGMWSQVSIDEFCTAIYFLLTPEDFSALHRLPGPEIYHHYAGAPVELTVFGNNEGMRTCLLGDDLETEQRPVIVVEGGTWQGSRTLGEWSLVGTTMAPPYRVEDFELGDRDELCEQYPSATDRIRSLSRPLSGG